jgi:SAM-dependent methyltransferase
MDSFICQPMPRDPIRYSPVLLANHVPSLTDPALSSRWCQQMTEWTNFSTVFHKLGPPLRPSPSDVQTIRNAIYPAPGRVLLLGVTPELADLGNELIAVDNSAKMLAAVWPGDNHRRRARLADWSALPFGAAEFEAVIGDGSLNSAPDQIEQIMQEVRRVLSPTGKAVFRVFCSPEKAEEISLIRQQILTGWNGNVHALKWRIAMALAAGSPSATVPVSKILRVFNHFFPDRAELASSNGWDIAEIDTLDAYENANHSLSFPTLSDMRRTATKYFKNARVFEGEGYPLSNRCPTILWY